MMYWLASFLAMTTRHRQNPKPEPRRHFLLWVAVIVYLASCKNHTPAEKLFSPPDTTWTAAADTQPPVHQEDRMLPIWLREKYIVQEGDVTANILKVVNLSSFTELTGHQDVMDALAADNYASLPDSVPQLFQVYQRNDAMQIPNFITVDVMIQLLSVYQTFVLRTLEEKYLIPALTELCQTICRTSLEQYHRTTNATKELYARNAACFAVPYQLLTGKTLKIPAEYQAFADEELAYMTQQESRRPALPDLKTEFDYGVFKPTGHYTRSSELRKYFRAWKWVEMLPQICTPQRMKLIAQSLQSAKTPTGVPATELYARLTGTMWWFTGKNPNAPALDAALQLKRNEPASYHRQMEAVEAILHTRTGQAFVSKEAWKHKQQTTAAAMRLRIKHDVLLYGVVPEHPEDFILPAAEDTLPPKPLMTCYVEPALPFWTALREWVEAMQHTLDHYQWKDAQLQAFSERMHRYVAMLEDAARQQLDGTEIPDSAARFMAHIGDSIQRFTLDMTAPPADRWEQTAGTDRTVAIFEKANRHSATEASMTETPYDATGNVLSIYVIVEINGDLYITKGAAYSYYGFSMPAGRELQEKDWQEMLQKLRTSNP